jgi:hypothetical protein
MSENLDQGRREAKGAKARHGGQAPTAEQTGTDRRKINRGVLGERGADEALEMGGVWAGECD